MTRQHPQWRILYRTWYTARKRCYDPTVRTYRWYGARGISMAEEWREDSEAFATWILANLGPRPEKHSLDRIDGDKGYEPSNLRWADTLTQSRNRRLVYDLRRPRKTAEEKRQKLNGYMRAYRAERLDYMNELSRKSYAKLSADPEWMQRRRDRLNAAKRLKKEAA